MGRTKMDSPKKKRKRDVNKPKRATSAYFFFLAHKREESKRAGRSISKIAEFTKECSEIWRKLGPKEKEPFENKAAQDKNRYSKEMALYKGKSEADKDKPKRPPTAYFVFLGQFREQMKGKNIDHKDLIRKAGEVWRGMSDADKEPHEKKSQECQRKYELDVKAWREGKGAAGGPSPAKQIKQDTNGVDDDDEEEDDDDEEDDDEEEDDE